MGKSEWILGSKKCLGLYMSGPCRGPGWGNPGYYCAVYEISEYCKEGEKFTEWRTRVESGPAVRDYTEGYEALSSLYQIFLNRAMNAKEEE